MTRTPAPREPRHTRGGAGGAGRGQWVRYPLRLVVDAAAYADADTKIYGKVKALSKGRACEASVARLAEFTGLSVSAVQKGLRRLSKPAPTDGVEELTRVQRTHRVTGKGRTNERTTRVLDEDERYVCAPVRAADALRGTLHRLYLLLRYTTFVEKRDLTLAEIADVLRHHGGESAGQPLHEGTVAHLLDELEGLGWITQDKRGGYRGRHAITVHDDPLRPAGEPDGPPPTPGTPAPSTPDAECGAAPDLECGAPAYKEDHVLTDPPKHDPDLGGSSRRRRGDRKWAPGPVDTFGNPITLPDRTPATATAVPIPPPRRPYDGPGLQISTRVWTVLEPVHDLLPALRPFVMRRIAREIGHQLDTGIWAEDINAQLARLRRWTMPEGITDPGRWLLGAVLPVPPGRCGTPDCARGVMRFTGIPCKACAEQPGGGRGRPLQTSAAPATVPQQCPGCAAPYRPPLRHPNCRLCNHPLTA